MAKKFYYHGKNNSKPESADGKSQPTVSTAETKAVKPEKSENRKPQKQNGEKRFDRSRAHKQAPMTAPVGISKEVASVQLESAGVSTATCELLAKNHINTLGDLVARSEKDMFKVQGFNKKMLFELRDAMKSKGVAFKPEQPKQDKKQQVKNQPAQKTPVQKDKKGGNQKVQAKPEKPEKLTEPLPVERWRKIQKGGKWGFYDGFKTVIPATYDEVFCFKDGLASVELDEKCGYIDSENNVVIPFEYETAMSFSEGLASVSKVTKFGYINKENQVVIPFEYDAATQFENGEAKVKKDGKWGTITPDGEVKWII